MGEILLGTCSWTDKSLIESGKFYPPEVNTPEERLRYYASQFPTVEVDSTYYALPSQRNAGLWADRTPKRFIFHVKAFSLFTWHPTPVRALPRAVRESFPDAGGNERVYMKDVPSEAAAESWRAFQDALLPLESAGKLGLVLFQFPPWFTPRRETRDHILACKERLPQYKLAVEFRNSLWLGERDLENTLSFLRENDLTFVCVDEPQGFRNTMPPLAAATSDQAYVRFHGRNAATWNVKGESSSERFNYYYTPQELQEWVPKLKMLQETTKATYALFNTNYQDQGPANARQLKLLLDAQP